jgi:hypothetical protein
MTTPQRDTSHGKEVSGQELNASQEIPCIFDHADRLLLVTRFQDDGTHYDYCHGCGWVDIANTISQTRTDTIEEIEQAIPKIDHADNPFQSGRLEAFSEVRTILTKAKEKR